MYEVRFVESYAVQYNKLVAKNSQLIKKIEKTVAWLCIDPFHPGLRTHRANTRRNGLKWSSFVTGDIRIVWDFDQQDRLVIILFDLGGHSGGSKVYR